MDNLEIKKIVRERYANTAKTSDGCCGSSTSTCCSGSNLADDVSKKTGYSEEDLKSVPEGANLGLGCGNPVALASLKLGETVIDLGSGPGFDCFLAANKVGPTGKVIGIDMTPEMLDKARQNASKGNYSNVEFRLGEIENLPVADNTADVIISNCVINLSPQKDRVFKEAFRILKPGGRLMVSDIVLLKELPPGIKESVAAYSHCIAGASQKADYINYISNAGFQDIKIVGEITIPEDFGLEDPLIQDLIDKAQITKAELDQVKKSIVSVKVHSVKPAK